MTFLPSFLMLSFMMPMIVCQCPSACPCQSKTMTCEICLASYYQTYNVSMSDCQCINGFEKFAGGGDFCCPSNCRKCYHRGCASCKQNAEISWNNTHKHYECRCVTNYYRIGKSCLCLANRWPDQFYANPENEGCHVCPPGCICTEDGCVQCSDDTNRFVKKTLYNLSICSCQYHYVDNQGVCQCPKNCQCKNGSIVSCSPLSHRHKDYKSWPCIRPYREINGSCHCLQPYAMIDVFGEEKCLCKSKTNYTGYHEVYGICKPCGKGCTCSKQGCVSCASPFRAIRAFQCICHSGATEINGECACIDPYYDDGSGVCKCLIDLYPTLYYKDQQRNGECKSCPAGCKCSKIGCYQCQKYALRWIRCIEFEIDQIFTSCSCGCDYPSILQEDGTCECPKQYYYNQQLQQCVCLSELYPTLLYYDGLCKLCPELCKCDETGCYQCHESAFRQISIEIMQEGNGKFNLKQAFICRCIRPLFEQEQSKQCKCLSGQEYDEAIGICVCIEPNVKILNRFQPISNCRCGFETNPSKYFIEIEGPSYCFKCPIGCKCSEIGCYDCEKYAMRYIDIIHYNKTTRSVNNEDVLFRCPCYQDAFEIDGNCTICPNNSYFNGEGCTLCRNCRTCNPRGCLTCNEGMDLVNGICMCRDTNLRNVEGYCSCMTGFYMKEIVTADEINVECVKCPNRCLTCYQVNDTIRCLSCSTINTNRQDISEDNCPCKHDYVEHRDFKQYCCSIYCEDCDAQGCLSCPLFTFRTLKNGYCQCLAPFEQVPIYIDSISKQNQHYGNNSWVSSNRVQLRITCGCEKGTYYSNQSCLRCPSGCTGCYYDSAVQAVKCTQCQRNSNRNESSENSECLENFEETVPTQSFCSDRWCANVQSKCSRCAEGRMVNEHDRCVCPNGQFEQKSICRPCFLEGCLKCHSRSKCQICDAESRYYLLDNICVYANQYDYLLSQTLQEKLIMQIQLETQIAFTQISVSIYEAENNTSQHPLSLEIISSQINQNNIFIIKAESPNSTLENAFISFLLTSQNSANYSVISTKVEKLISNQLFQKYGNSKSANAISFLLIPFLLTSLIVSMSGYKHNQAMFFLQTMTLIGYYLDISRIKTTLALHNLRYSFFKFTDSPYFPIFPGNYFQSSEGNFKYTTVDSNFIRMTETLIIVQAITIFVFVVLRTVSKFLIKIKNSNEGFHEFKKRAFRLLKFMFECCMYPLMFFSTNAIINYDCTVYVGKSFKKASIAASITVILIHAAAIFYLCYKARLSRLSKSQHLSVFLFSIVTPIVIIFSIKTRVLCVILVILIFLAKDLSYLFFKRKFSEVMPTNANIVLQSVKSLEFVGAAFQIVTPILIELDFEIAIVVFVFVTLTLQLVIQIIVIYRGRKESDFEKIGILSREQENRS